MVDLSWGERLIKRGAKLREGKAHSELGFMMFPIGGLNMTRATRRHIIMGCIYVVLVVTPLSMIPFFPEVGSIQALYTSSIAFLGLVFGAGIISVVIDRILFGKPNVQNDQKAQ